MKTLLPILMFCLSCIGSEMVPVPVSKLETFVNDHAFNKIKFVVLLDNKNVTKENIIQTLPQSLKIVHDEKVYEINFENLQVNGVNLQREVVDLRVYYNFDGKKCNGYWIALHLRDGIPQWDSTTKVSIFFDYTTKFFTKITHSNDVIMFNLHKKLTLIKNNE